MYKPHGIAMLVRTQYAKFTVPLPLQSGSVLREFTLAYETYGQLHSTRDNVILICHGLTASAHAAGHHTSADPAAGWWDHAIGPGRMFDTDRYFVVCSNVLGGCNGSTGPACTNPDTGRPYAMSFPVITVADMVSAQVALLDSLGIERLHAIAGGCLGGFQALEWLIQQPERVAHAIVIGATAATSAHTIALWEVMRRAIYADPAWHGGDYYDSAGPATGMALSLIIGVPLWMSRETLQRKYGRRLVGRNDYAYALQPEFAIEQMIDEVARSARTRFDANSLIYLTKAMDYFDLGRGHARLSDAFQRVKARSLLVSYRSDWRYPPVEIEQLREALAVHAPAEHVTLDSSLGHGAFLFDISQLEPVVRDFLDRGT